HVEERIRRLRDVLQVELVAEVRRVLCQHTEPEERVDGAVFLLEAELELGLVVVELVEVAHHSDCSPRIRASTGPFPCTESPGSSGKRGSRTKSRWARGGCGKVRPGSSTTSSPKRRRSRSIGRGPYRGPSRTRPSSRSISSSRSRSSRGPSSVSTSAA